MGIYRRGAIYWASYTDNGIHKRESLKTASFQEAQQRFEVLTRRMPVPNGTVQPSTDPTEIPPMYCITKPLEDLILSHFIADNTQKSAVLATLIMLDTGARIRELEAVSLNPRYVVVEDGTVMLPARRVPMTTRVNDLYLGTKHLIAALGETRSYPYVHFDAAKYEQSWTIMRKEIGIEDIGFAPLALRETYGMKLIHLGLPLDAVAYFVGLAVGAPVIQRCAEYLEENSLRAEDLYDEDFASLKQTYLALYEKRA